MVNQRAAYINSCSEPFANSGGIKILYFQDNENVYCPILFKTCTHINYNTCKVNQRGTTLKGEQFEGVRHAALCRAISQWRYIV